MLQAQMGNMQSEAEYRNAQMEGARQKAMREAQIEAGRNSVFEQIAQQNMPTFRDASAAITGVNPTADYVAPQNRRLSLTPQLAAQAAKYGIKPEELAAVFDAGLPKVARTIEGIGASGAPETLQLDEFGRRVGLGIGKPVEKKFLNTGGSQLEYDPFMGPTGRSIANTMSPDAVASNAVARDRLNLEMRGRREVDKDRGIIIDPDTGEAKPITLNGQPVGAKEKDLNENQSNAALFAGRMQAADKIIADLGSKPSVLGAAINQNLTGTPLIGGTLSGMSNLFLSKETKQYLQAERDFITAVLRRESGAAIAESEYDTARKTYFPQPNDPPEVIQQKADARARAIAGIAVAAGPSQSRVNSISETKAQRQNGLGTQSVSGEIGGPNTTKPSAAAMTPENVKHTAKLYGISEDQVLQMLGAKR